VQDSGHIDITACCDQLVAAISQLVVGKECAIRLALVALLARGHLLIEDVPGTGKTTLARALAGALGKSFRRIQFTPDLLPADILGVSIYRTETHEFEFRPGPIFAEVVLADEINRATPRTQAALLEAMQEGQVSIDGESHALPQPFMVLATQNSIEMDGTFRLPEAQLDRFLLRLEVGYPDAEHEEAMLAQFEAVESAHNYVDAIADLPPVEVLQERVLRVQVGEFVRRYLRQIIQGTRTHEEVRLGASPRAALALQRASQAHAAMAGRVYALPDDVKAIAPAVLGHRLVLETQSTLRGLTGQGVVAQVLEQTSVPIEALSESPASQ
jgi:MoxR-like ATPase